MSRPSIDELIEAAIEDGSLSETERRVLDRRAAEAGWDLDEFHVILEGRLQKRLREQKPVVPPPRAGQNKYGTVRKCPACGAVVKAGLGRCQECDHEFAGVEAVSSARQLSELVAQASRADSSRSALSQFFNPFNSQVQITIQSFPIPNTAEDLLEFCLMCESRGENDAQKPAEHAYYMKYCESISKAKVYFASDPRFQPLFARYEKRSSQWSAQKKAVVSLVGIVGGCMLLLLLILLFS